MKRSPDFSVMIGALTILVGIAGMMWLYCRLDCSDLAIQFLLCLVAVGTALSGCPPHRSVRAELPHTALTLGVWRRSARSDTDAGSGDWESSDRRAAEPLPRHPMPLASSPQRTKPQAHCLTPEDLQPAMVAGDCMVVEVPLHHAPQPLALLRRSARDAAASAFPSPQAAWPEAASRSSAASR